ncbi:MAG TPA: efflux RND transporter periplasmic adaptor subunit [Caldimonas sp.]
MKRAIIVILIIGAIGAVAGAYYIRRGGTEPQINTSQVTRGDITDTVGATGTLQAVTTVQVGSQVSGNISWLGADFNSIVKKNQVIAKLDPSLFEAQLQQAKANLVKSQADTERNKVALTDAQQKYTRSKELAAKSLLPQSDLDAAKIAVDSAQASLQSSQATVEQSKASLYQNQVSLDHTIINAPIDGIVIQRSVDVGQTVAASMSAPTLFILAADLTKMQVNANIDESDVGRIRPGQHVTFHVDAYPTESFQGTVAQIRLQPVVVQNVTTYGTVIDVPNQQLKLKPGMTATVKVEIAKRSDVLRVPNASLRFRPSPDMFAALNQAVPPEALASASTRGQGGRSGGRGGQAGQGSPSAQPSPSAPAASAQQAPGLGAVVAPPASGGRGGVAAGGQGFGGQGGGDPAARLERFKAMTPDEQKQFIDRMKSNGRDTSAFEALVAKAPAGKKPGAAAKSALPTPKYGAVQSGETIDALFAPLPVVETRGRAWLYMDKQLKPVNLRLGITDGTNTELLSGELQQGMELVTSILLGSVRPTTTPAAGAGNPLMPSQRGGPGRGR